MFSLFDDDAPQWSQPGQGYPENRNTMARVLRTLQTGCTVQNTFKRNTLTGQPSRWAGMDPGDIPFMDHDTTIPTADRFPHNPLGPAVPGPEYVDPATGRFDMDKYMDMVGDRLEVGYGNTEPLAKYRLTGAGADAGNGVQVAQMQFGPGGATQTNPGRGGQTTNDEMSNKIREEGCRRAYAEYIKGQIDFYNRNRRPNGNWPDPRTDPSKSYEAFRRAHCGMR